METGTAEMHEGPEGLKCFRNPVKDVLPVRSNSTPNPFSRPKARQQGTSRQSFGAHSQVSPYS
jgi:hypothetical protein